MDNHRIIAPVAKHTDLQKCPAPRRPNHHDQVIFHLDSANSVANGMFHVIVGDSMVTSGLADPHLDKIACLTTNRKEDCPRSPGPSVPDRRLYG